MWWRLWPLKRLSVGRSDVEVRINEEEAEEQNNLNSPGDSK